LLNLLRCILSDDGISSIYCPQWPSLPGGGMTIVLIMLLNVNVILSINKK
jgi:hypothetical protein